MPYPTTTSTKRRTKFIEATSSVLIVAAIFACKAPEESSNKSLDLRIDGTQLDQTLRNGERTSTSLTNTSKNVQFAINTLSGTVLYIHGRSRNSTNTLTQKLAVEVDVNQTQDVSGSTNNTATITISDINALYATINSALQPDTPSTSTSNRSTTANIDTALELAHLKSSIANPDTQGSVAFASFASDFLGELSAAAENSGGGQQAIDAINNAFPNANLPPLTTVENQVTDQIISAAQNQTQDVPIPVTTQLDGAISGSLSVKITKPEISATISQSSDTFLIGLPLGGKFHILLGAEKRADSIILRVSRMKADCDLTINTALTPTIQGVTSDTIIGSGSYNCSSILKDELKKRLYSSGKWNYTTSIVGIAYTGDVNSFEILVDGGVIGSSSQNVDSGVQMSLEALGGMAEGYKPNFSFKYKHDSRNIGLIAEAEALTINNIMYSSGKARLGASIKMEAAVIGINSNITVDGFNYSASQSIFGSWGNSSGNNKRTTMSVSISRMGQISPDIQARFDGPGGLVIKKTGVKDSGVNIATIGVKREGQGSSWNASISRGVNNGNEDIFGGSLGGSMRIKNSAAYNVNISCQISSLKGKNLDSKTLYCGLDGQFR